MATYTDIINTIQSVYLNNTNDGGTYPRARLFTICQEAFRILSGELHIADSQLYREIEEINYTANAGTIVPTSSIYKPTFIQERAATSTNDADYTTVSEVMWERPEGYSPATNLTFWAWREGVINVMPATTARKVRAFFDKEIAPPTAEGDPVLIPNAETFLAAKASEIASMTIGNNPTRAQYCAGIAERALTRLKVEISKAGQGVTVRRKPWRVKRRIW